MATTITLEVEVEAGCYPSTILAIQKAMRVFAWSWLGTVGVRLQVKEGPISGKKETRPKGE